MLGVSIKPLWMAALATAVVLAAMLAAMALGTGRALSQESCADPGYATDHILVKMREGTPAGSLEKMKALNGEGVERELVTDVWSVNLPAGLTVPEAVEPYGASPDVEYAEPDYGIVPAQDCQEGGASVWVTDLADSPDPVTVGEELTYAATVRNYGPDPAVNTRLWSDLPEGVEYVSSSLEKGGTASPSRCSTEGVWWARWGASA